ncbi:MAG: flippase activity-associated protein Agl23 [Acidimicrobiales bacterium]
MTEPSDVPENPEVPGQLRLDGFDESPRDAGFDLDAGFDDVDGDAADEHLLVEGRPTGGWSSPFATAGWGRVGVIVIGVVVVALAARVAGLGDRPLHHDESLDAWFSWRYLIGTYEGYDPVYHGPLRFYMTAWFYWLFGESETTARMWAALSGVAVVALVWAWRRDLGDVGTVASVILLAVSPSMLYFSRFGREDSLFLAITLVIVILLIRYVRRPAVWHPLALLCLVVAGAAVKESIFLVIFVFGAYALTLIAQELLVAGSSALAADEPADDPAAPAVRADRFDRMDGAGQRRLLLVVALVAMIIAFFFGEPIFISLGVYGAFLTAMLVAALLRARRRDVDLAAVPVLRSLVAVPAAWWAGAVAGSSLLFVALFTQFFTEFDGPGTEAAPYGAIRNGLVAGFEYWRGEQDTLRGDARWQYYLALIPAYEWLVVGLAVVGIVWVLRRPGLVGQTLVFWGVGSLAVHSWAGERMPWLVIHPLLPFVLLAGLGVQVLWERRRSVAAVPVATLLVVALGFTVWTSYQAAYVRGGEPRELFVQAGQATEEVPAWVERLELLDRLVFAEQGRHLEVAIDADVYWPYGWYLRDFPTGTYAVLEPGGPVPTQDVVFLPHWKLEGIGSQLVGYTEIPYEHRWWWVPRFAVSPGEWLRWVWDRTPWDGTEARPSELPGTLVGSVYVRDEILELERRYLPAEQAAP